MDDLTPCLTATDAIESDHPRIRALAAELTAGLDDEAARAAALFLFVRDQVAYSIYNPFWLPEHYRATAILDRGRGYCVQKSVLLCALARAASIPSRLVFADIRNQRIPERLAQGMGSDRFVYHCYTDLHIDGQWLQATPSFDRALSEEHGFPLVEFDGTASAVLPEKDVHGQPFVTYLAHHGSFTDLPLDTILAAWDEEYGPARIALWRQAFEGDLPAGF